MYKEELQKKKERLEALRSRLTGTPRSPTPGTPTEAEQKKRKPSDEISAWLREVMSAERGEIRAAEPSIVEDKEECPPTDRPPRLARSELRSQTIAPRERISYSKECQTMEIRRADNEDEVELPSEAVSVLKASEPPEQADTDLPPAVAYLSDVEKAAVAESEGFLRSLKRAACITERLLAETAPPVAPPPLDNSASTLLTLHRTFFDDSRCRHRVVTGLDWSPTYPELLATSYSATATELGDNDGVCLVWNLKFRKQTPDFAFSCASPLVAVTWAPHNPHLLIGGCHSGRIVQWDTRSSKRTPVMRSPLSTIAHTAPVYSVRYFGSRGAQNLLSVSSDGVVCSWPLDRIFSQPLKRFSLKIKRPENVTVTCSEFFDQNHANILFGTEEGPAYLAGVRYPWTGVRDLFRGHDVPVTGVSTHSSLGPIDFYHLFLTSSMDWSVKLWSVRDRKPLHSFNNPHGYVYDVGWSPKHPAVFATANDSGDLDIWDLNKDQEASIAHLRVYAEEPTALNKLRWHSSGQEIAVGDAHGRVHICKLAASVALPAESEWFDLEQSLKALKMRGDHGYLDDHLLFAEPEQDSPKLTRSPRPGKIRSFFRAD